MPKVKEMAAPKKPVDPKRAKKIKENAIKAKHRRIQKERTSVVGCFMAQNEGLTQAQKDEELWYSFYYLQHFPFYTARYKMYKYVIRRDSILILRQNKRISKESILSAFHRALELKGNVPGPTDLKVYGSAYIHPVLLRLGIVHIDD